MPLHRTPGGGWQWGTSGKIYYGKGARRRAAMQAAAIKASGWKEKTKKK